MARFRPGARRRAVVRQLIDHQVTDTLTATTDRLDVRRIRSIEQVRQAPLMVKPSSETEKEKRELENLLFERVYRHPRVLARRAEVQQTLRELFELLVDDPDLLPPKFSCRIARAGIRRTVADYVAGMTDRFALEKRFMC